MPEIIMPKVGDAMTEGKVVRWYMKAGDKVTKGEPVLEIETDKVNLDLEAEADGTLGELQANEGQMVPVGETLAQILAPGEKPAEKTSAKPADKTAPAAEAGGATQRRATDKKDSVKHTTGEYQEAIEQKGPRRDKSQAVPPQNVIAIPVAGSAERRRSSPLARRMALDLGVPLESLQGSGPQGRIVAKDVQNAARKTAGATPKLESKSIPLSAMRRTIAKRLVESTGPIPHFYLTVDYDVTQLVSMRQQLADIEGAKISLNDFIIRAIALSLGHHPNVNASWGDDAIEQHGEIHVGVAVSTPEGLITPVIRNADQKRVSDIAKEVRALAEKAKNRKLLPNEYQGSTFTISNLGAWGIEEFTAIINPPNSAIVAIGAAEQRPVVVNGQIVVRDRMKVTMSCDHRVIDGALGAEFLKTLRQYIEQPLRLMM
ncbi:MAG TPA: dihydrolipoamide acetyltransferase family protein [Thermoanaerobaculia bacterium]|jgi:pyruvate dehydrogenase E2 component (dihydrolipoamide acetyltransferase)